jgi:hypothetical protein
MRRTIFVKRHPTWWTRSENFQETGESYGNMAIKDILYMLHPHFMGNFMLATCFFVLKSTPGICDRLFEDCHLEIVSTQKCTQKCCTFSNSQITNTNYKLQIVYCLRIKSTIDEFAEDGAQLIHSQNKTNAPTQNASADKFTSDNAKASSPSFGLWLSVTGDPLFEVKRTTDHSHNIRAPSSANSSVYIDRRRKKYNKLLVLVVVPYSRTEE